MAFLIQKMINAIFAIDEANGLGKDGKMPWPFNKQDLAQFKEKTLNQIVVMGKGTWDSSDMPTPLPKRMNIVVSSSQPQISKADLVLTGPTELMNGYLKSLSKKTNKDVFIIGGAKILELFNPIIDKAFVSMIPGDYNCDVKLDLIKFLDGFKMMKETDLGSCKMIQFERE